MDEVLYSIQPETHTLPSSFLFNAKIAASKTIRLSPRTFPVSSLI